MRPSTAAAFILIPFLLLALAWHCVPASGLEIVFFDIGQGDAAWIRFGDGTSWLVDSGGKSGNRNLGDVVVLPELLRRGVLRLDVGLLSHTDTDHAYGYLNLLKQISIRQLITHADVASIGTPNAAELRQLAKESGTTIRALDRPEQLSVGNAKGTLLPLFGGTSTNDRNLVVLIEYAGCRVFFAGDVEALGERELENTGLVSNIDLLKVAHHGSKTSSSASLVRRMRPRWSVISVGSRNPYGHPNREVITRLQSEGSQVLRTDFHGYVRFRISPSGRVRCDFSHGSCGESHCQAL